MKKKKYKGIKKYSQGVNAQGIISAVDGIGDMFNTYGAIRGGKRGQKAIETGSTIKALSGTAKGLAGSMKGMGGGSKTPSFNDLPEAESFSTTPTNMLPLDSMSGGATELVARYGMRMTKKKKSKTKKK